MLIKQSFMILGEMVLVLGQGTLLHGAFMEDTVVRDLFLYGILTTFFFSEVSGLIEASKLTIAKSMCSSATSAAGLFLQQDPFS